MYNKDVWASVAGFDGYIINALGVVKNIKDGNNKVVKAGVTDKGYVAVTLRMDGKGYRKKVHRLVLQSFIGECPEGMETSHINGDRLMQSLELRRGHTEEEQ